MKQGPNLAQLPPPAPNRLNIPEQLSTPDHGFNCQAVALLLFSALPMIRSVPPYDGDETQGKVVNVVLKGSDHREIIDVSIRAKCVDDLHICATSLLDNQCAQRKQAGGPWFFLVRIESPGRA